MKCCFLLLTVSMLFLNSVRAQLIINEFSQGANGAQEYIELVVVGQRNCAGDSCADIRGWIIDDNNGWYGASSGQGIAPGHMRFSNDPNWSCVPFGSIILLYNLGDKNPSITLADDPSDANNDNVYVIPSVSPLIEGTTATPTSPSATNYVYPTTGYSASPAWGCIGLANTGDAVIVVNPTAPGVAYHSIAYGNLTSAGSAVISKTTSGGAKNYYLTSDQYTSSAAYNVGNAPTDETPGAPNGPANATWINGMLTSVSGAVDNDVFACILQGGSYPFNGATLTTAGIYLDTVNTALGCDSIIHLHLSVTTPITVNGTINSCQPVNIGGTIYTTTTLVNQTLSSALGCDSAYLHIQVNIQTIVATQAWDTVSGCQSIVYKGVPYTISQQITDTIRTTAGCDSIYKRVYLNILQTPQITVPDNFTICKDATATLTATSDYPVTWDGYDAGEATITVSPEETTEYTARVFNELNCEGIGNVVVNVEDFILSLHASTTDAEIGSPVALDASALQNFSVTSWQPDNEFPNQFGKHQSIIFDKRGVAVITVTALSENNCKDTATIAINILPTPDVFIPSAFTPNGDGLNDYFRPEFIRDHAIRNFSIFNRYGQKVYGISFMQQLDKGWDGSYKGKVCDNGTYYYILSIQDTLGKESVMKGDVTLVN